MMGVDNITEDTTVGDSERTTLHFIDAQFVVSCTDGQRLISASICAKLIVSALRTTGTISFGELTANSMSAYSGKRLPCHRSCH